jgi:hypothetical protein
MNKTDMIKAGVCLVASVGVSLLVSNTVNIVASATKYGPIRKACISLGGIVLAGAAAEKASQYAEKQIDSGIKMFKDVVNVKK